MIKIIILILVIILLVLSIREKEKFTLNPELYINDFIKIDRHFRDCRKKYGVHTCIDKNPYKRSQAKKSYTPQRKTVSYNKTKKASDLLPIKFNR
tara:strand:- start:181 stop:465 length:285 start_codon:yes stop_codon:yes gene_type:complete